MTFWLDAQLPPQFTQWLSFKSGVNAVNLYDLNRRDATDSDIFEAAKKAGSGTVLITKDKDFVDIVLRLGTPPQILWLTCGNISNRGLQAIFNSTFLDALSLLESGEDIVEIC